MPQERTSVVSKVDISGVHGVPTPAKSVTVLSTLEFELPGALQRNGAGSRPQLWQAASQKVLAKQASMPVLPSGMAGVVNAVRQNSHNITEGDCKIAPPKVIAKESSVPAFHAELPSVESVLGHLAQRRKVVRCGIGRGSMPGREPVGSSAQSPGTGLREATAALLAQRASPWSPLSKERSST